MFRLLQRLCALIGLTVECEPNDDGGPLLALYVGAAAEAQIAAAEARKAARDGAV